MENLFPEIPAESAGLLTLHVGGEAIELNGENSPRKKGVV